MAKIANINFLNGLFIGQGIKHANVSLSIKANCNIYNNFNYGIANLNGPHNGYKPAASSLILKRGQSCFLISYMQGGYIYMALAGGNLAKPIFGLSACSFTLQQLKGKQLPLSISHAASGMPAHINKRHACPCCGMPSPLQYAI